MTRPTPSGKVRASDISAQLAEALPIRGTTSHLVVIEELLNCYPGHSRKIVEHLPDLSVLNHAQRVDLWRALLSPRAGRPKDPRQNQNHQRALRRFMSNLIESHGGEGVKVLGHTIMDHDDPDQYSLAMRALPNDDLRVQLASSMATNLFLKSIQFPEGQLAQCQALLDQIDPSWFETKTVREDWRWMWVVSSLRAKMCEPETSESILDVLIDLGVDINEPNQDGLNLLEDFIQNAPYGGLSFHEDIVKVLLDRGAEFHRLIGQDLPHNLVQVLNEHPAVKRWQLGEIGKRDMVPNVSGRPYGVPDAKI